MTKESGKYVEIWEWKYQKLFNLCNNLKDYTIISISLIVFYTFKFMTHLMFLLKGIYLSNLLLVVKLGPIKMEPFYIQVKFYIIYYHSICKFSSIGKFYKLNITYI